MHPHSTNIQRKCKIVRPLSFLRGPSRASKNAIKIWAHIPTNQKVPNVLNPRNLISHMSRWPQLSWRTFAQNFKRRKVNVTLVLRVGWAGHNILSAEDHKYRVPTSIMVYQFRSYKLSVRVSTFIISNWLHLELQHVTKSCVTPCTAIPQFSCAASKEINWSNVLCPCGNLQVGES